MNMRNGCAECDIFNDYYGCKKRGYFLCRFKVRLLGSEQGGLDQVIIIQNDIGNK